MHTLAKFQLHMPKTIQATVGAEPILLFFFHLFFFPAILLFFLLTYFSQYFARDLAMILIMKIFFWCISSDVSPAFELV